MPHINCNILMHCTSNLYTCNIFWPQDYSWFYVTHIPNKDSELQNITKLQEFRFQRNKKSLTFATDCNFLAQSKDNNEKALTGLHWLSHLYILKMLETLEMSLEEKCRNWIIMVINGNINQVSTNKYSAWEISTEDNWVYTPNRIE